MEVSQPFLVWFVVYTPMSGMVSATVMICKQDTRTVVEGCHGQDTREDTLVVTVEQTTKTRKACNGEDSEVLDEGSWTRGTSEGLTPGHGGRIELRTSSNWSHDD